MMLLDLLRLWLLLWRWWLLLRRPASGRGGG